MAPDDLHPIATSDAGRIIRALSAARTAPTYLGPRNAVRAGQGKIVSARVRVFRYPTGDVHAPIPPSSERVR